MAAISLKQQKQGELIATESIEGVAKAVKWCNHPHRNRCSHEGEC
jgi:hypothetical protein